MNPRHLLESIATDGTGLRMSLEWHQDRYQHVIDHVAGSQVTRLMESSPAADPPCSPELPVLQQLSIESRPGSTQVALGVGMSGQNHWSMSIETAPDSRMLLFDVACRVTEAIDHLASGYQLATPLEHIDAASAQWQTPAGICKIQAIHSDHAAALDFRQLQDQLFLQPQFTAEEAPYTLRWQYRVIA